MTSFNFSWLVAYALVPEVARSYLLDSRKSNDMRQKWLYYYMVMNRSEGRC